MADVAAVAADLKGLIGLRGEMGLAMKLFAGELGAIVYSLIGERGSVRELWDRGESTELAFTVRDAVRVPGAAWPALVRLLFFNTGRFSSPTACSFSLSDAI